MDTNREEVHRSKQKAAALDATPVNMKQHYLKRKSGGVSLSSAVSSPCSPHLSRLGASLNKVSLAGGVPPATSPLTPMSEASTPLTEVGPFAADTASVVACDDDAASWSIQCSSPHGQAGTGRRTVSLPNALLAFEENMSSPSGGLAKLAVSESHEDDFDARYSRPCSQSAISGLRGEGAGDAFQMRLAPRNFDVRTLPSLSMDVEISRGCIHFFARNVRGRNLGVALTCSPSFPFSFAQSPTTCLRRRGPLDSPWEKIIIPILQKDS